MAEGYTLSPEDVKLFLDETLDQLEVLEEEIVKLEGEGHDPHLLQDMFRIAHTVKGSSATVGHSSMSTLAHAMEDVFAAMRDGRLAPCRELVNVLLEAVDGLRRLAAEFETAGGSGTEGEDGIDVGALVARLSESASLGAGAYEVRVRFAEDTVMPPVRALQVIQALQGLGTVAGSRPSIDEIRAEKAGLDLSAVLVLTAHVEEAEVERKVREVSDVRSVEVCRFRSEDHERDARGAEGGVDAKASASPGPGAEVQSGVHDGAVTPGDTDRVDGRQRESGGNGGAENGGEPQPTDVPRLLGRAQGETIRVGIEAFDRLVRIVSELAIDEARLAEVQKRLSLLEGRLDCIEDLEQITSHMARLTTELQEEVMKARMTPLASLFKRFPRMVRDTASSSGKLVDFVVEGEDTELDRALIEEVADPIIHLLRNAVGHGIEPPEERVRRGKPEKGRVRLAARHVEDRVVIVVEDDGGGIDLVRVREAAVRKGLIAPEAAEALSDEETIELIFQPGFSTASQVSDVSGRGVGLDIVRTNIEKLGGTLRVRTSPGKGSTFVLSVPLTLAVFRALLVDSCGQEFAVPLSSVVEVTRVSLSEVKPVGHGQAIVLRGRVLPVFDLRDFAGGGGGTVTIDPGGDPGGAPAEGAGNFLERPSDRAFVVVAKYEDMRVGIIVDSLLGEQEIVIKSLGKLARSARGVLGGAILGDGRVALILDVARVLEKAMGRTHVTGPGVEGGNEDRSDYQLHC
ncbi:MAG: chemotaxis protein CheA [Firmicutes bacterium]|nr:chemotaxis protein CheA [Bacillota bacterium]MDH7496659.1 chemotaxis protein CheA [Bacillota bacterium]